MDLVGDDGTRVILAGVDGSPSSLRAGVYAAGMARRQRSWLVIVYVVCLPTLGCFAPDGAALTLDATLDATEALRQEVLASITPFGIDVVFRAETGDPAAVIARVATEMRADLVVVGASSRLGRRLARLLVGSVAGGLVRTGRWPVTIVP